MIVISKNLALNPVTLGVGQELEGLHGAVDEYSGLQNIKFRAISINPTEQTATLGIMNEQNQVVKEVLVPKTPYLNFILAFFYGIYIDEIVDVDEISTNPQTGELQIIFTKYSELEEQNKINDGVKVTSSSNPQENYVAILRSLNGFILNIELWKYSSICGNELLEQNEICDDGNQNDGDSCKNNCTMNVCGDSAVYSGIEQCDDGNIVGGDGCSSTCQVDLHFKVFATKQTFNGLLGGLGAADLNCGAAAKNAGLSGNWKAWLSDTNKSASQRLLHSKVPYLGLNGKVVAFNWADLTDGNLSNPINVTEDRNALSEGELAWTGTATNGNTALGQTCYDWKLKYGSITAYSGDVSKTDGSWTAWLASPCNSQNHLYCIEQGAVCGNGVREEVEQCDDGNIVGGDGCSSTCQVDLHFKVFATKQTFNGLLGGLGAADLNCGAAAKNAGLSGNWKAWLSDTNKSASQRLLHSKVPYLGLNGKVVAFNWADLTDGNLSNPINVTEDRNALSEGELAWTGTATNGNTALGQTCYDWKLKYGSIRGYSGDVYKTDASWTAWVASTCNTKAHLYCIEQGAVCGNGVREEVEQCDDGNLNNFDGCSAACTTETIRDGTCPKGQNCKVIGPPKPPPEPV